MVRAYVHHGKRGSLNQRKEGEEEEEEEEEEKEEEEGRAKNFLTDEAKDLLFLQSGRR